ncbi:MAG: cyclic 2,3-diphosphoglycerate synthase [Phycisphaerae bacterium]|nr:cyclic 2,3-diphosphoglycerate synthase [Phycisphaerae bacterium]
MPSPTRILIMGAAGRDFHNFNVLYRDNPDVRVVAFTATQIPGIEERTYPAALCGSGYPDGIPIYPEERLAALIRDLRVDQVVFAYSDVSHEYVMNRGSAVQSAGAAFVLPAAERTMLRSRKPVIAVCAVRTGCGKSQTSRRVAEVLKQMGKRVAVVRHPMPYGDLTRQVCQRFGELADLDRHECTIEEREEYELHIRRGNVLFAGIDYAKILAAVEAEADVVLWDGGNNDTPFFKPDLHFTVTDPHRAGHERRYYPGETNFRLADVIIINKCDSARAEDIATIERNVAEINPRAKIVRADSTVTAEPAEAIRGKRVILVEDGPTLTHGEMALGAAKIAAQRLGAAAISDPRPHAVGSMRGVYQKYAHLTDIVPAMGYGRSQMADLAATINATPGDVVLIGTPIDLAGLIELNKPTVRIRYELAERGDITVESLLRSLPALNK